MVLYGTVVWLCKACSGLLLWKLDFMGLAKLLHNLLS